MKNLKKIFDIFSIVFAGYILLYLLLFLINLADIEFLSFIVIYPITFGAEVVKVVFEYASPVWVILFALYGYHRQKKLLGLTEKKFESKVIPKMLPTFIINCALLVALVLEAHYMCLNTWDRFF